MTTKAPRNAKTGAQQRRRALSGKTPADGPPPYDPVAVGEVARRVEIQSVELIGSHFERDDDGPLPAALVGETTPEIGLTAEWRFDAERVTLGCVVSFGTVFDGRAPYELLAQLRLTYRVDDGGELRKKEIDQFVHWNAVFNVWPYWREYLSSTINRAQLPRFFAPVMGVPRPGQRDVPRPS